MTYLQEKAARLAPIDEIRTVLNGSVRGVLSTISQVFGISLQVLFHVALRNETGFVYLVILSNYFDIFLDPEFAHQLS